MINKVCLIDRTGDEASSRHALDALRTALAEKNITISSAGFPDNASKIPCIVAGLAQEQLVSKLCDRADIATEEGGEGVVLARCPFENEKEVFVIAGTDQRGLMYALFEAADRIRFGGFEALWDAPEVLEYADVPLRGVDRFIMSRRDDGWYFSDEFWAYFIERLARSRFNRLTLITGFDTAYLSPPYPFFVEVPGFDGVTLDGDYLQRRETMVDRLRKIADLCHEYAIEFCFSTWQQLPWTENQKSLVSGLPETNNEFADYCAEGLYQLLIACPQFDMVQFRVNLEAGIRVKTNSSQSDQTDTDRNFWKTMLDAVKRADTVKKLELRAKGLTDDLLEYAKALGFSVAVPTKYWCEHQPLPYHIPRLRTEEITHLNNANSTRRYSYDDLLRKPRWHDMVYRLWNYGTCNLFLWGDPDYVRRFAASCLEGDATGFTITCPLSLKGGHAMIPGDDWLVRTPVEGFAPRFEDERYFMWYLVFGRVGYQLDAPEEIWQRELGARYGAGAEALLDLYRTSGRILPLITTAHLPVHPSLHYWPETYTGAALFGENNYDAFFKLIDYAHALPSDEQLFCSIAQMYEARKSGIAPDKITPLQVAGMYASLAKRVREGIEQADALCGDDPEWMDARVDFSMLADIAEFHLMKLQAACLLCEYQNDGNQDSLQGSYRFMLRARDIWQHLSDTGTRYFARNLCFEAGTSKCRNGNWSDRLKEIDADLENLRRLMGEAIVAETRDSVMNVAFPGLHTPSFVDDIPDVHPAGEPLTITVYPTDPLQLHPTQPLTLYYRHTCHREGHYLKREMQRSGNLWRAEIPAEYLDGSFDLNLYISGTDDQGEPFIYPGLYHDVYTMPYALVRIEE